jgi:hypothetical protein
LQHVFNHQSWWFSAERQKNRQEFGGHSGRLLDADPSASDGTSPEIVKLEDP